MDAMMGNTNFKGGRSLQRQAEYRKRNMEILELRGKGLTLKAIGDRYGLSTQAVRQLIIVFQRREAHRRKFEAIAAKRALRDQRWATTTTLVAEVGADEEPQPVDNLITGMALARAFLDVLPEIEQVARATARQKRQTEYHRQYAKTHPKPVKAKAIEAPMPAARPKPMPQFGPPRPSEHDKWRHQFMTEHLETNPWGEGGPSNS